METVNIRYTTRTDDDRKTVDGWLRARGSVIRSAYANAEGRTDKDLKALLAKRFPHHPLGSWDLHCAVLEARTLRKHSPDGKMVFGGRKELLRRQKGLISNADWKARRDSRAITTIGDRTRWGNRHFRLSEDARTCRIEFLGNAVELNLVEMVGKHGLLARAVAKLAAACEISVQFCLTPTHISITIDPMDLRKLPGGMTLEDADRAIREAKGHKPRGRPRKDASTHYAAHRVKPVANRPVHPEWRAPIPTVMNRTIGVDFNPEWIAITVVEITGDPQDADKVRILDHQLHRIAVPIEADSANMTSVMANVAAQIVNLARAWNCGSIFHEDGLGKLAWSKKSRGGPQLQTVNYWSRNTLLGGLGRRCLLAGITLKPIWGGYSTTIGNMLFDLPDACAAAAEIARRGIASAQGIKDRFPVVPVQVASRRWKDEKLPTAMVKALASADTWQAVHRAVKSAQDKGRKTDVIGYRRLHPSSSDMVPGRLLRLGNTGYAVNRLGNGKGVSCSARPVHISRTVRNGRTGCKSAQADSTLKSE